MRILPQCAPSPLQAFLALLSYIFPLSLTTYGYCFCSKQPVIFMWDLKNKNIFLFPHTITVSSSHFYEEIQFSVWCHCPVCRTSLKCFLYMSFLVMDSFYLYWKTALLCLLFWKIFCWIRNFRMLDFNISPYIKDVAECFLDYIVSSKESVVHTHVICHGSPETRQQELHCFWLGLLKRTLGFLASPWSFSPSPSLFLCDSLPNHRTELYHGPHRCHTWLGPKVANRKIKHPPTKARPDILRQTENT